MYQDFSNCFQPVCKHSLWGFGVINKQVETHKLSAILDWRLTWAWHVQVCTSLSSCQHDSSLPGQQSNAMCRKWQVWEVGCSPVYTTVNPIKLSCDIAGVGRLRTHPSYVTQLCARITEHLNNWVNLFAYRAPVRQPGKSVGHVSYIKQKYSACQTHEKYRLSAAKH